MRVVLFLSLSSLAFAADLIPFAKQNELVAAQCAVCHNDAARNGGLSLQHFDAAKASPSLIAMMLAKLNTGAFGASGKQGNPQDEAALKVAFAEQSKGATDWSVERGNVTTASIMRTAGTESYRIIATCDAASKRGSLQLAWAPIPKNGTLNASADGKLTSYTIDVHEKMGTGGDAVAAGASAMLNGPLPTQSLTVGGLFPDQTVTFPFAALPQEARQALSACFN
jgi:hypothetical protein